MAIALLDRVKTIRQPASRKSTAHEIDPPISVVRFCATALAVWLSIFLTVRAFASPVIGPDELEREIAARVTKVEEFETLRAVAKKMGVRVYLFGGTAAGFAHYVKWDLQRQRGDKSFQTENFDYDYTNIYRSTQDLDIVLDGTAEQATELERMLMSKYAYMKGGKSKWEVRLLREKRGEKIALLDNPDFLNQHTDSNSTGLIEITKAPAGEAVRDLRDWKSDRPFFLRDVAEGKIHYYDSPLHETTSHFRNGENPEIISVIRFLTKAFQFELEMRPEELATIQRKLDRFDARNDLKNPRAAAWIEKNASKLIQNAVNIEYAVKTLDALGLRKKLVALGNFSVEKTMAWWLSKEPLRTKPVGVRGAGSLGKTAGELGYDIVAHETRDFMAYESITRSHRGDANVLTSRSHGSGEAAAFGDGFYVRLGRQGARGSNITIRFHIDPKARMGTDFTVHGDYLVVLNKAALKVIPESLRIDLVDFVELVTSADFATLRTEYALMEKLRRRLEKWSGRSLSRDDKARLRPLMESGGALDAFMKSAPLDDLAMVTKPFMGSEYEAWFQEAVRARSDLPIKQRLYLNHRVGWEIEKKDLVEFLNGDGIHYELDKETIRGMVMKSFDHDGDFEVVKKYIHSLMTWSKKGFDAFHEGVGDFWDFAEKDPRLSSRKLDIMDAIVRARELEKDGVTNDRNVLVLMDHELTRKESWPFVDRLLRHYKPSDGFLETLVKTRGLELGEARIDQILGLMENGKFHDISRSEWLFMEVMDLSHEFKPSRAGAWLGRLVHQSVFATPLAKYIAQAGPDAHPGIIQRILTGDVSPKVQAAFADECLWRANFVRPEWLDVAIEADRKRKDGNKRLRYLASGFVGTDWSRHPDVLDKLMAIDVNYGALILKSPPWLKAHPRAVTKYLSEATAGENGAINNWAIRELLSELEAEAHPEWLEIVIRRGLYYTDKIAGIEEVVGRWRKHPVLLEAVRLSGGVRGFLGGISVGSLHNAFVVKKITVEQARASLARPRPSLVQKWLKPRMAAPVTCPQVFGMR